jgi:hypothetical protein
MSEQKSVATAYDEALKSAVLFTLDFCSYLEGASFGDTKKAEEICRYLKTTSEPTPEGFQAWWEAEI